MSVGGIGEPVIRWSDERFPSSIRVSTPAFRDAALVLLLKVVETGKGANLLTMT
jgi:hypothetical protein